MIKPLVFLLFSLSLICFTINGQNLKDKEGKRTGKWIIFNSKDLKIEEGKISNLDVRLLKLKSGFLF
mgnify:CR=1 FL=1